MSLLDDMTAPYSAIESWAYDALVAPAVISTGMGGMVDHLLDEVPRGAEVLEVGCGGGQLMAEALRRRPDLTWTGLDLSPEQIARAKKRGRGLDRARWVVGSALDLPFEEHSFDAVLSVASIKHWPDPARGLRECVRVLRPGGRLLVIEADRGCRFDDARAFVSRWRLLPPLRPVFLAMFRTHVAGRSLDLDDARELVSGLDVSESVVERLEHTPALMIRARR